MFSEFYLENREYFFDMKGHGETETSEREREKTFYA